MNTRQIQALLTYLGYDPGEVDGVSGRNTRRAVTEFQTREGLETDGIPGAKTQERLLDAVANSRFRAAHEPTPDDSTGSWWKDIRYFRREEFRCPCGRCGGFPVEPDEKMVRTVEAIRAKIGKAITISSGVRCQAHNDELPGSAKNSYHIKGMAADLHCAIETTAEMKAAAEAVMGKTGGIGLYKWGIHVDVGNYSRWNG